MKPTRRECRYCVFFNEVSDFGDFSFSCSEMGAHPKDSACNGFLLNRDVVKINLEDFTDSLTASAKAKSDITFSEKKIDILTTALERLKIPSSVITDILEKIDELPRSDSEQAQLAFQDIMIDTFHKEQAVEETIKNIKAEIDRQGMHIDLDTSTIDGITSKLQTLSIIKRLSYLYGLSTDYEKIAQVYIENNFKNSPSKRHLVLPPQNS